MDRREPPRIGSVDASPLGVDSPESARAPSRRFARLVTLPTARKLALSRVGRAGIMAAVVLGLLVVGGSSLSQTLVRWLHGNKVYQLAFQDIQLIPEPPKWIKPGRVGLLEQVRESRDHLKLFSMAELNLANLRTDFSRNPWVARVGVATKDFPNKVAVHLDYFEPVAWIRAEKMTYVVDPNAIVLPEDDIDLDAAGPLITIVAVKPREVPKPGLVWPGDELKDRTSPGESQARVVLAAKVAGFIKHRLVEVGAESEFVVPKFIFANNEQGLFVQLKDDTLVFWGRFKDSEAPGEPSDSEKWDRLLTKAKADGGLKPKERGYLDFFKDSVRFMKFRNASVEP